MGGIPTFEFIEKTPNALQVQSHNWFIPRNPVPADTFTQIPLLGTVAFTTTGLPIYGPNEAERPDPYGDPYINQILDFCHGHTGGQGDYHFHAAPENTKKKETTNMETTKKKRAKKQK